MSRRAAIAIAAVAALSVPSAAFAHAHLVRAVPAAGGTVREAPAEVVLSFSEKVEPAFSSAVVRDATGKALGTSRVNVDKADPTVLRVSLPRLDAGAYTVEWRVMSADTHKVSGSFSFRVGE